MCSDIKDLKKIVQLKNRMMDIQQDVQKHKRENSTVAHIKWQEVIETYLRWKLTQEAHELKATVVDGVIGISDNCME